MNFPRLDFSPLADLPAVYQQAQSRQTLADLGRGLADGTLDYRQAAATVAKTGDLGTTIKLLTLGSEEDASKQFQQMFGPQASAPQAVPAPATPSQPAPAQSPSPKPMTLAALGPQPTYPMNDAGVPPAPPRAPVQPTARVWGDQEAERAGLYEPQRVAGPAQPTAPSPAAPAQPQQEDGLNLTPRLRQLIGAASHPRLPSAQKEIAKTLLTRELENTKLPDPVKKYLFAKGQGFTGSYLDFETQLRKSGATTVNVDTKGEGKFEEEFGKKQADRWNKYIEEGQAAQRKLVDIETMREIHQRAGSQGVMVNVKETLGPFADAMGVSIDGLSDIQAYSAIVQRLAPQQRAPGSGSTSDIEFKGFVKSMPGLIQNSAAREITLNTMEALTRDEIARGEIASRLATKEITRGQAEAALRNLPDPMKGFAEWRKANPQIYAQSVKPSSAATSTAAPTSGDGGWQTIDGVKIRKKQQ